MNDPGLLRELTLTQALSQDEIAEIRGTGRAIVRMTRGSSLLRLVEADGVVTSLRRLDLEGTARSDVRGLEQLTALEMLGWKGPRIVDDVAFPSLLSYGGTFQRAVFAAPRLQEVSVVGRIPEDAQPLVLEGPVRAIRFDSRGIVAFPSLRHPEALREAKLWGGGPIDLSGIAGAINLQTMWLFGFPDITGFDHLAALPQIEKVMISMCERLSPLQSLIEMPVPVHGNVSVRTAPREVMVHLHARGWNAGHEP